MSSLKTQTIHTTTPYTYTYSFDFNFNPYEKKLSKNNLKVYINFELTNDFDVDFDNKQITLTGDAVAKIDEDVPDSLNPINDGFNLSILRHTDISKPSVEFTNKSRFDVKYINYTTNQLLFKQQELQEQLFFIRDQLKSVAQFNENEFKVVSSGLITLQNRINVLNDEFSTIDALLTTLSNNYNVLKNDYLELLNNYNQLALDYSNILNDYNSFINAFNIELDNMVDKTNQMNQILTNIQNNINILMGDHWRLGQIISLHPTIAEQNKTRLVLAGGQSYFDTDPQVSELKNIYPSDNGLITMPNMINDFVQGYISIYIVKSEYGISGTELE